MALKDTRKRIKVTTYSYLLDLWKTRRRIRYVYYATCVLCDQLRPDDLHLRMHEILKYVEGRRAPIKKSRKCNFEKLLLKHRATDQVVKKLKVKWHCTEEKKSYACGLCVTFFPSLVDRSNHYCAAHFSRGQDLRNWDDDMMTRGHLLRPDFDRECQRIIAKDPICANYMTTWWPEDVENLRQRLELVEETAEELVKIVLYKGRLKQQDRSHNDLLTSNRDSLAAESAHALVQIQRVCLAEMPKRSDTSAESLTASPYGSQASEMLSWTTNLIQSGLKGVGKASEENKKSGLLCLSHDENVSCSSGDQEMALVSPVSSQTPLKPSSPSLLNCPISYPQYQPPPGVSFQESSVRSSANIALEGRLKQSLPDGASLDHRKRQIQEVEYPHSETSANAEVVREGFNAKRQCRLSELSGWKTHWRADSSPLRRPSEDLGLNANSKSTGRGSTPDTWSERMSAQSPSVGPGHVSPDHPVGLNETLLMGPDEPDSHNPSLLSLVTPGLKPPGYAKFFEEFRSSEF